mgnify:CR=1 FL=1
MTSIVSLARLEIVPLREAWPHEALNFTPWLALPENLALLADAVGMMLELEAVEKPVEAFSADILAKDVTTGRWVLIENQLESTDHSHLGQILTYAAGLDAETVIWIARDFREPHRAAIDYLNRITAPEHNFFGVQVELLRIGSSEYAPRFNVVAKPNDWSKSIATKASASADSAGRLAQWQAYWEPFFAVASQAGLPLAHRTPPKEGWCRTEQLRSGDPSASAWLHRANDRLRALIWLQGDRLQLFDALVSNREDIEMVVGEPLVWDRTDNKKSSMVYVEKLIDEDAKLATPAEQYEWFVTHILKLTKAMRHHLKG